MLSGLNFNFEKQKENIRTRPRATQQGRVKCKWYVPDPMVPTQEAIPEEGGCRIIKKHMFMMNKSIKY